jgi:hypothetical protein
MRSKPLWLSLVVVALLSLSVECGVSVPESVAEGIDPSCGNSAAPTAVTVRGTLPVNVVAAHEGSEAIIDGTYQAWIANAALTEAKWIDAHILTAMTGAEGRAARARRGRNAPIPVLVGDAPPLAGLGRPHPGSSEDRGEVLHARLSHHQRLRCRLSVAQLVTEDGEGGNVRDINGNTVGQWTLKIDGE